MNAETNQFGRIEIPNRELSIDFIPAPGADYGGATLTVAAEAADLKLAPSRPSLYRITAAASDRPTVGAMLQTW